MSLEQSMRNILKIEDLNLKINSEVPLNPSDKVMHFYGELTYQVNECPFCRESQVVKNGFKTSYIRLPPVSEMPAILVLRKQRYLCRNSCCQKSFLAQTSVVQTHKQISQNLRRAIIIAMTQDRSMSEVAAHYNVSVNVVQRLLDELRVQMKPNPESILPESLCIDEFRSVPKHMSFIAIDAQQHDIITLLPDRKTKTIEAYFMNTYPLSERLKVKQVVVDFNASYFSMIHRVFPEAMIVADRFHLVQMVLLAIDQERIHTMKHFNPRTLEYRTLKFHWRLFLMSYDRLNQREPQWFPHLKDRKTQEQVVWQGLDTDTTLESTYLCGHKIAEAIRSNDLPKLVSALQESNGIGERLASVIHTFKHNQLFIENMIQTGYLSNGPIEGVNRKIKQIKRTAFGLTNWPRFETRIRIEFTYKIRKRRPIRK